MPIISGTIAAIGNTVEAKRATKTNERMNAENNAFNAQQAEINRQFNATEAQKQRDYETEMSNTAIQRKKQDLIDAGLNPMLAVDNGGASTPSVSAASGSSASSSGFAGAVKADLSPVLGVGQGIASLASSAYAVKQIKDLTKNSPEVVAAMKKAAPVYLKAMTNAKSAALLRRVLNVLL